LVINYDDLEQTIRVVDEAESRDLNLQFRGKDKPTNVLSFPSQSAFLDYDCLGDMVICAPLVSAEAERQEKAEIAHWAHLVVHGMLHLQGFDHENTADAAKMEALEVEILSTLGYSNPYDV
jgi:probable rRNA maturation factor